MIWLIAGLVLIAFGIAFPTTLILRAVGRRLAALDTDGVPGQVKAGPRGVPNTGGPAIFLGIAVPMLAGLGVCRLVPARWLTETGPAILRPLGDHLEGVARQTPLALTFLACLGLVHGVGLIDDRRPLGPGPKAVVMFACALALVLVSGTRLLEAIDPFVGGSWLSLAATVLWIVLVTNAMNFMDNMDGLSGGVALVAGACFLVAALLTGQLFIAAVLALMVGAVGGFLVFNFPPASVFMGDSGSLVLGLTLGFLTVQTTYYGDENGRAVAGGWYAVFMPLVVLAVPLYDLLSVSVIRVCQGRSPFVGDLQHLSHRLVGRGLSRRSAVVVICGLTGMTGISGILLASLAAWQAILVGVQTILVLVVLALFEWRAANGRRSGDEPA